MSKSTILGISIAMAIGLGLVSGCGSDVPPPARFAGFGGRGGTVGFGGAGGTGGSGGSGGSGGAAESSAFEPLECDRIEKPDGPREEGRSYTRITYAVVPTEPGDRVQVYQCDSYSFVGGVEEPRPPCQLDQRGAADFEIEIYCGELNEYPDQPTVAKCYRDVRARFVE